MQRVGSVVFGALVVGVCGAPLFFSAGKVALPTGLWAPRLAADESRGGQGSGLRAVRVITVEDSCACPQPRAHSPEQNRVFPQPARRDVEYD